MPKSRNLQSIVVVGYFAKSVPLRNFNLLNISYPFDVSSKEIVVFLNTFIFNYKDFMVIIANPTTYTQYKICSVGNSLALV